MRRRFPLLLTFLVEMTASFFLLGSESYEYWIAVEKAWFRIAAALTGSFHGWPKYWDGSTGL